MDEARRLVKGGDDRELMYVMLSVVTRFANNLQSQTLCGYLQEGSLSESNLWFCGHVDGHFICIFPLPSSGPNLLVDDIPWPQRIPVVD
jgi:hypothetical protein